MKGKPMEKQKRKKRKATEVAFTVLADKRTHARLRVLGAISGLGLCREGGRRITESIERDTAKEKGVEE